jgi:uncharacterized repeat protein (TIGR01451 family)
MTTPFSASNDKLHQSFVYPKTLNRLPTMNRINTVLLLLVFSLWSGLTAIAQAEPHRATHLGNPATRFADPLKTPDDLRRTLLQESLQDDVQKILRMSGYLGDMKDFRHAAANAQIDELSIPVGTLLPAMSTRKKGKVDLLRNVLWAGKKPIDAYEFSFISGETRYRVVTPKACSNFWVEEKLPRPRADLALSCEAPTESPSHKSITVCNTLVNQGELSDSMVQLLMSIPAGTSLESVSQTASISDSQEVSWTFEKLAAGEKQSICATFTPSQLGQPVFNSAVSGKRASSVSSQCETRVFGIPAVLLEVIDVADPILVGKEVVYVIRVLNQGTLPLTNVKVIASMESGQRFLSGSGASEVSQQDELITPAPVPLLNPKETVEWQIVVKAEAGGDVRFNVGLLADQFSRAIMETEATFQY